MSLSAGSRRPRGQRSPGAGQPEDDSLRSDACDKPPLYTRFTNALRARTMNVRLDPITMACAAVLTAGCASAPSRQEYIAPTAQTILASAELMTMSPGQVLYVENRSSVPVLV